jgi:uncharacterized protein YndB with AHSA1/START domain
MSDHASTPERIERAERLIPATPQEIFDLLADPRQHAVIDGSGTVRQAHDDVPARLALGAKFGMRMRQGVPYSMTNEVVEFEEPTLIAWRHLGGHVWRYRLEPTAGGTLVTEEFDWGPSRAPWFLRLTKSIGRNRKAIDATLARLAEHFGEPGER